MIFHLNSFFINFCLLLWIRHAAAVSNNTTTIDWNQIDVFGTNFETGHLFDGVPLNYYESLPGVNMTAMNLYGNSLGVVANLTGIRDFFVKKNFTNSNSLKKRGVYDDRVSSNELAFMNLFSTNHVMLPNSTIIHISDVTIVEEPLTLKKRQDCDDGMWRNFADTKRD